MNGLAALTSLPSWPKRYEATGKAGFGSPRLLALQRSWRYDPAVLDAIDSRADKETAYTTVTQLIEYLGATWPRNRQALQLVVRLAATRPRKTERYDHELVLVTARIVTQGWDGDQVSFDYLLDLLP